MSGVVPIPELFAGIILTVMVQTKLDWEMMPISAQNYSLETEARPKKYLA